MREDPEEAREAIIELTALIAEAEQVLAECRKDESNIPTHKLGNRECKDYFATEEFKKKYFGDPDQNIKPPR